MTVSNPKRVRKIVLCSLAALLVGNLGRLIYRDWKPIKAHAASSTPYTVVRMESGFDKTGNLRYTNKYVEALRGDGSIMRTFTSSVVQQRRIEFANGDYVLMNELLGKMSTYPKRFPPGHLRRDPQASCFTASDGKAGSVIDGQETISGYRTVRFKHVGSTRTIVEWRSLDVGCALLQSRFEHEDGLTVQNLAALTIGEPPSTLFEVPKAFQEVQPSSQYEPICKDGRCTSVPDSVKQSMDKKYNDLRAKTP